MTSNDAYTRPDAPAGELALCGPSPAGDLSCQPIRGDLAHIRLAGLHFVPHYAVPMPHAVRSGGSSLQASPDNEAESICRLEEDTLFEVLDIAGDWAWGQASVGGGEGSGPVGYLPLERLEAIVP